MRLLSWTPRTRRSRASRNNGRILQSRALRPRLEELETRVLLTWSPHLLADLNLQPASSDPNRFLTIGAITYFSADDGVHGRELWRTDGTAAGTFMVKDIDHGAGNPVELFNVNKNGKFLFTAGVYPNQMWVSDGTAEGTRLIKEFDVAHPQVGRVGDYTLVGNAVIFLGGDVGNGLHVWRTDGTTAGTFPLQNDYTVSGLTVVGNTAFFTADDATHGVELWKTDGTIAGTVLVKDINPGAGSSDPVDLTVVGNQLLFVANDGVHGRELWRSDGTDAGTFMVRDINPGPRSAFPPPYEGFDYPFTVAGNKAFFIANDGTDGKKLWVSDGTTQGTHIVVGAAPGSSPQYADDITASGSAIYYTPENTANPELWRSDGTPAGTYLVKQLNPAIRFAPFLGVTTWNGLLYFLADDGTHHAELWVTDGTSSGTSMVQDISGMTYPCRPIPAILGTTLYFFLIDDTMDVPEFWKTDGTPAGTALVADVDGRGLVVANGQMLFAGTDSQHGTQLWHSDGTTSGTALLKDINPGTLGSLNLNRLGEAQFVGFGGSTYFAIDDPPSGAQLWKTDGTSAGTQLVAQVGPWLGIYSDMPRHFTVVGNTLFFVADDTHGEHLWKSDGTTAGTVMVTSSDSGGPNGIVDLVAFKGNLYFSVFTNTGSGELWTSDGTAAGTVKLASFATGSSIMSPLVIANGLLFFVTSYFAPGNTQLWESDGTAAGTTVVQTLAAQSLDGATLDLFGLNGELYYPSDADGQGWQLWKTDGTTAGTMLVKVLTPGADAFPTGFVNVNGLLYFTAFDGTGGNALWRSDGSSAGTQMVFDFPHPGANQLTNVNGHLFLAGPGGLWQSDGTAQGTSMVAALRAPGIIGSSLTAFEGHLFFVANNGNDAAYLPNLWVSDGTQAGTNVVGGIRQEGATYPTALTAIGNALYFFADDGIHGMEPWIFTQTTTAPARSPLPADLSAAYFARPTLSLVAPEQPVSLGPTTTAVPARQTQSHRVWMELTASSATAGASRLYSRHVDALFSSVWGGESLWQSPA